MQSVNDYDVGDGKREKCIDNSNEMNQTRTLTYVEAMHIMSINEAVKQWEHLECIANALVFEYIEEDILEVKVVTKQLLQSLSVFYDRAVILFFYG